MNIRTVVLLQVMLAAAFFTLSCGGQTEQGTVPEDGNITAEAGEVGTSEEPAEEDLLVWLGEWETRAVDAVQTDEGWLVLVEAVVPRQYAYGQLFHVSVEGNILWSRDIYGRDLEPSDILAASDGSFLIACSDSPTWDDREMQEMEEMVFTEDGEAMEVSYDEPSADFLAMKVASDGSNIWERDFHRGTDSFCCAVMECGGGDLAFAGTVFEDHYMFRLVRTDPDGNVLWDRDLGTPSGQLAECAMVTSDGNFLICGQSLETQPGTGSIILVKAGGDGREIWTGNYGNSPEDRVNAVAETPEGNYAFVGSSTGDDGRDYAFITLIDPEGDELWSRSYDHVEFFDVAVSMNGGFIVCGGDRAVGLDPSGEELWIATDNEIEGGRASSAIQIDENSVLLVGYAYPPEDAEVSSEGPLGYLTMLEF